ncbi:MAG: AAA family ATPase [Burkholderiaceae bacterium]
MNRIEPQLLARRTDPASLTIPADCTAGELASLVGHGRAAKAISYALGVNLPGYNLFVMGPLGIGKSRFVRAAIAQRGKQSTGRDWVYVHNFESPDNPVAISLEAGDGLTLRNDARKLLEELKVTIPASFESDTYANEVARIQSSINEAQSVALKEISEEALKDGIGLIQTPQGFSFAPVSDGEVIAPEAFNKLSEAEQERLRECMKQHEDKLQKVMRDNNRYRRDQVAKMREVNRETTGFAVDPSIDELKVRHKKYPAVCKWLEQIHDDLLENFADFLPEHDSQEKESPFGTKKDLGRFEVNLLTRSSDGSAPIIEAEHPTLPALLGRVDYKSQFGGIATDFRLIKPGKLHEANGGYLLIDAWRLFSEPYAWDALKRSLQRRAIQIESVAEAAGSATPARLEPASIPLDVKVILFGERYAFYTLSEHDPDFAALFRVVADFDNALPRDDEHANGLVQVLLEQASANQLQPLDKSALARLLDQAARLADDATRLSSHVQHLSEVAVEADHVARSAGATVTTAEHVRTAIADRRERVSRSHLEYQRSILRGTMLIDTDGREIGQVNGLAVYEMNGEGFGHPSRITATTRLGDGTMIDIQRETQMGGAVHTKGMLILTSYLAARYAARQPLPVNASLVFEQSYGPVDGDSATIAELCALLSSLSSLPVRQDLAVTGSMNQQGEVQAIGGANEKIEGFFDICKKRGLTGTQGVIIPASNVEHLMLTEEVVDAAAAGQFHIYSVSHVDEALELLLDAPVGSSSDGPQAGTIGGRVQQRLSDYLAHRSGGRAAARRARYAGGDRD